MTIPALNSPTITMLMDIALTYPYVDPPGGTPTLIIRAPEFGNTERHKYTTIHRYTRGGKPILFGDPSWPKEVTFTYNFHAVSKSKKDEYLAFLKLTLGKNILFRDYENQYWKGILLKPDMETLSIPWTKCGEEMFDTSLEFQGVLLSWP